ncbi:MAG: TetR/AcrR family transcriptional regulator [Chitinophagaceae bacterium]|mgnify:CR=1 FL=1|nr:TetR/AcrR family transcriptional regulator [Bacteroidota bacterium]MCC6258517.1 TetR/AcrR family transcriptional regulator [Chitinophagaceae bacterium]MCW5917291.1 TetR/AcrR family transcriptional regulator [Ferruginibacter sp.]
MALSKKHIHILNQAEKLFAKNGYDATTVRDIAEAAGVNLAMISYYFGSKEKLLEALFMERMASGTLLIREINNMAHLNPWQKIQIMIDEYVNRAVQKQDFFKVMISEQVINQNPVVINYLRKIRKEYAELIGDLILQGQKEKIFCKKIDLALLLTTMTGTVKHMLINQEFYRHSLSLENMPYEKFQKILTKNLQTHIRKIFKSILGYDPQ